MDITFLLYSTTCIVIAVFYCIRRRQMSIFKSMGIPGPEPNFLVGNLLSFALKNLHEVHQDWTREYGSTFGYFEGPTPVLVTSDVKILHQVFVKQFSKFHARKVFPVQVDPDKDEDVHMFFARGERWKRLRSIINPAFSSAKMRRMSPLIKKCVDDLVSNVTDNCEHERPFDIHDQLGRLTMDSIVTCAMSQELGTLKDNDEPFLKHCKGIINNTTKRPLLFLLGFTFPTLHALWIGIYYFLGRIQFNPVFWVEKNIQNLIEQRKKTKTGEQDMLQLMVDARFKGTCFPYEKPSGSSFNIASASADQNITKSLSNKEIVSQAMLFTLAGYETTSTTLSYVFYELATNPDVQDKVWEEIKQQYPNKTDIPDYDNVRNLAYMDMVINETLRKYVVASNVMARECMEPACVEGIRIPKGMLVQADVWSLHRNSEHWGQDTDSFIPERFTTDNRKSRHTMAWMPFGGGPRMCAGLRFALLQAKIATVQLIRNFHFTPSPSMKMPLELIEGATVCPKDGIHLYAKKRS